MTEEIEKLTTLTILDGTFFKIIETNGNFVTATCTKCFPNEVYIKGSLTSSSNFKSHLKRKHDNAVLEEYEQYCKNKRTKLNKNITLPKKGYRKKHTQYLQKQFEDDITKYIVHSMVPLRTVEDPFFIRIFKNLGLCDHDNSLQMISRRTVGRRIEELYETHITNIKKILNEDTTYVCTTADVWSSRKRSFFGVTAHWIDNTSLERRSTALACRRFRGTHSFDKIAQLLHEIHLEFGLDSKKIVATISDNASNFVKAFRLFGVKLSHFSCDVEISKDESTDDDEDNNNDEELKHIPISKN